VYERLFAASVTVTVEFHDHTSHCCIDAFLAVGRERGACISSGSTIELRIGTSRWFRLPDGQCRQVSSPRFDRGRRYAGALSRPGALAAAI
jgi:hypothetical protein